MFGANQFGHIYAAENYIVNTDVYIANISYMLIIENG